MGTFLRTPDGRLRAFRVGACIYVFNTVVSLIGDGWHSVSWIAWLLMAFGFSQMEEGRQTKQLKWFSLRGFLGIAALAAMLLGVSLLFYHLYDLRRAR